MVNLALFVLSVSIWTVSLIVLWFARNSPTLRVVRPFVLSFEMIISLVFFSVATSLNLAIPNLPCGVLMTSFLFALAGFATNYFVRAVVFTIESQFALNASKFVVNLDDSVSDLSTFSKPSKFSAIKSLVLLTLGVRGLKDVEMNDIVVAKRSYGTIILLVVAPSLLPIFVLFAVFPEYSQCHGCPIFLEVNALFFFALFSYNVLGVRILYVAWKFSFPDSQGILLELKLITFLVAPGALLIWGVMAFDPTGSEFNRSIMYEYFLCFIGFLYWLVCVALQLFSAWRYHSRIHISKKLEINVTTLLP